MSACSTRATFRLPSANEIADTFRDAVAGGLFVEKTIYYRVQRDCLALAKTASAVDRAVLVEAARAAETLGRELEDDAIDASYALFWRRYAVELEKMVRLAGSGLPAAEILERLKAGADAIGEPKSGLYES